MNSTFSNDTLACMVKENPELESAINTILADNKKATSMFVHELRNPLSLLKGTVQYIEMKHPEAKDFKYWDQIQELVTDMEQIMADASLFNTYNYIHKEDTNLILLIKSLVNSFMPQAFTREIDLSFRVEPGSEAFFTSYSCDGTKLKQGLINLVKNAFEATSTGNFIQIFLRYLPGEINSPSKLSFEISNNGLPIPEDVLEKIFVPFVTYKKGGTGIGLALVKKIVDMHYGSISVESDTSITRFTIQLPV
jgi:signal transduction histidine kinase